MRVPAWQVALDEVFLDARARRFRWGYHDCCQFAARCVLAITGDDKRAGFASYRSKAQALEILESHGGMLEFVSLALGRPIPASFAGHGDVVLIDMGRGVQPAICCGIYSHAPGRVSLESYPTSKAIAAWKV